MPTGTARSTRSGSSGFSSSDGTGAGTATFRAVSSKPGPIREPTQPGGSRSAVAGVTTIWPADATCSASTTALAVASATTSSRWDSPTTNRCSGPVWTPTDIRSRVRVAGNSMRPAILIASCISMAATEATCS